MNVRKRPAEEPLLPLYSAKQQRTRMVGYNGDNSTPTQDVGLLSRWKSLSAHFTELASDTLKAVVFGHSGPLSARDFFFPNYLPNIKADGMQQFNSPSISSRSLSNSEDLVAGDRRSVIQTLKARDSCPEGNTSLSCSANMLPRTFAPSSSSSDLEIRQHNGLSSPFSSPTRLMTSGFDHIKPDVNGILPQNSHTKNNWDEVKPRNYKNREHIYSKAHKAQVRAETERMKEEMQRKLYTIKRSSGLLAFQAKLEQLDHRDAFSQRESSPRRHSYSDTDDMEFLRRALQRAKATLNEPRPPQPFQPTLEQLRLAQRRKDEGIEQLLRPKRVPPTPLPPKDDAQVDTILRKRGVVSKYSREQVSDTDLSRLRPGQWLNDEIINFYGALILGRSDDSKENPPKQANGIQILNVHYFNTFFWPKLKEGYEKGRLAKWTKKVDLFSKDVVLIPVNHSNAHWTSAVINFRKKRIESYDSMGTRRDGVFKALRIYLDAEHQNKKKKPFDFTGWQDYSIDVRTLKSHT
ncbi:hypothetical protein H0H93_014425 [Arthromyces matolae]|nr:hypothetical protein H0H93_014425 [Arthromyces matolae]